MHMSNTVTATLQPLPFGAGGAFQPCEPNRNGNAGLESSAHKYFF